MKGYWGSGRIALRILDLGTGWKWVVGFTLGPLYPQEKSLCYPLDRRLGGPHGRSGRRGEKKNFRLLKGIEPPIILPVAQCCPWEIWHIVRRTQKRRRRRFRASASIFRFIWISFLHNVLKRVRNRTMGFCCVFGSTDGPLNVRRILRIWLCAYLLSS
jgi:hypothetical protein